jgi:hypothetical protein
MMTALTLMASNALAYNNPHILEVDLSIEGVDDPYEVSPGGFVAKDGLKKITLHYTGVNLPTKTRLNWDSDKIEVDGRPDGTDEIYWDPASTMPTQLWVRGLTASDTGPDGTNGGPEHLCLEAINNGTPYLYDRIAFTVVAVTNIEYCRKDLDDTVAANWATKTNIAAGGKESGVHNAQVRISIAPAVANVPVAANFYGGCGGNVPAELDPLEAQTTDANGQVFCNYKSGNKIETATVVVTNLADSVVNVDLGSTVSNTWDIADKKDFMIPEFFIPEVLDDVRFYPTLEKAGGVGAIDTHVLTNYVSNIEILKVEFDLNTGLCTETTISRGYPDYWYSESPCPIPYPVEAFVKIDSTIEAPVGVYSTAHTVHDQWDYDAVADKLIDFLVMGYDVGACDLDVRSDITAP